MLVLQMIGTRDIEDIRKLTPGQRIELGLELLDLAWGFMLHLPEAEIQRRLVLSMVARDCGLRQ